MSPLPSTVRRALLELARQTIAEAVRSNHIVDSTGVPGLPDIPPSECGGAFVTLHTRGRLRGCIGRMEGAHSLADTVVTCAVGAALHDPRFAPLTRDDLDGLDIEISVLSPPVTIGPADVEVGRHGLLIAQGASRGVLLPQVAAERNWTAQRFLEETCRKAGLRAGAWQDPETQILAFTAEVFSEKDFSTQPAAQVH